ncbi:acyl-CoA dehydrogenase family protein [Paragemmobacter straminiformis]|uniref:Acyl-CoA dehydrogenase n=1 Tax=Paragemmobacter straminiformis TaxID=2045119 RepID=A0A842IC83_9RHOB|nr:acyl-CoA dehydrogenase family protein [Gemmobacter straminiformis]MBC2837632.1 hypothetical protein [Gemmobacter straminiformis]
MDAIPLQTATTAKACIEALGSEVIRLRPRFERERRLPDELFAAMVRADLFRLSIPRTVGGAQLGLRDWFGVMEAASSLDASVGWVLANVTIAGRMSGFLPPETVSEWFSSPDCAIAGSTAALGKAVPTTGGYLVSGKWPFASGIHAARRVMGLCEIPAIDDPYARVVCAFMPIEAVQLNDDWHTLGLRGSGSVTFEADGVFVPESHVAPFLLHRPVIDADPYHLPHLSIFPLSVTLVALGITQAAIADFAAMADRTRGGTAAKLAERELVQTEYGRCITLHRSARSLVLDALDGLESAFATPGERAIPRATFRASLAQAGELCETVMTTLCRLLGTASISETSSFERRARDLTTATRHVAMGTHNLTVLGRLALGQDAETIRF